jgi:hypothetical protein
MWRDENLSGLRRTVNDAENLSFLREVCSRLYVANPAFEFSDELGLVRAEPALSQPTMVAALENLNTGVIKHG